MPLIATVTLIVRDYDEAIAFYVNKLGFSLVSDEPLDSQGVKRWVTVQPTPSPAAGNGSGPSVGAELLLAKAANETQKASVGNQTGGRVGFFLETDDFERDYKGFREKGVKFLEEPRAERYGKVVQFEDLYGNKWDLLQRKEE